MSYNTIQPESLCLNIYSKMPKMQYQTKFLHYKQHLETIVGLVFANTIACMPQDKFTVTRCQQIEKCMICV